jgi:hypothetical protein
MQFLPPNPNFLLQPLDQGVTVCLKLRLRRTFKLLITTIEKLINKRSLNFESALTSGMLLTSSWQLGLMSVRNACVVFGVSLCHILFQTFRDFELSEKQSS